MKNEKKIKIRLLPENIPFHSFVNKNIYISLQRNIYFRFFTIPLESAYLSRLSVVTFHTAVILTSYIAHVSIPNKVLKVLKYIQTFSKIGYCRDGF